MTKKRKRTDDSRTKCDVCGNKNERRLKTCFFCGAPVYHGKADYWVRKLKRFFHIKDA